MTAVRTDDRPSLLFVVTEDWYFCSHRLPLAVAARAAGYKVTLAAREGEHAEAVRACGIAFKPWTIERGSTGLLTEVRALYSLWKIYREVRPDLVHQVALKPVLYGSLIARLIKPKAVVNALGGMGSIFTSVSRRKVLLKSILLRCFKALLSGADYIMILQNEDDAALMVQSAGLNAAGMRLIRGAGVNLQHFEARPEPQGVPLVVLPARMLWDKGIGEYVEAARLLREQGVAARFALVGGTDECNPSAIVREQLTAWTQTGVVEWWGLRKDMPEVLRQANIVCLPSYREGLPKALLEAAASARAIVTTDVPGCRDVVRHGENGLLVPVRNAPALAAALRTLLEAPGVRAKMGQDGRAKAEAQFSEARVVAETLGIYDALLASATIQGKPARGSNRHEQKSMSKNL